MDENWFYLDPAQPPESRRVGPLSRKQMEELAALGTLAADFLVWYPGLTTWIPWKEAAPEFAGNAPQVEIPVVEIAPTQTGTRLASPVYAPFGIRLAALLIDLMILSVANALLILIYLFLFQIPQEMLQNSLLINIPGLVLDACYQVYFLSQFGGTPGKMLLGLKVVTPEGDGLTVLHAFGRYIAFWLSALTLGIGFLIVLFDPQRRALHDHLAGTRVQFFRNFRP